VAHPDRLAQLDLAAAAPSSATSTAPSTALTKHLNTA
jgi:hypothetical protein